jgi:hypothetical protein
MRDYASKVIALCGDEFAAWRRRPRPAPATSTLEPSEQCWEGEGGRVAVDTPAGRSRKD